MIDFRPDPISMDQRNSAAENKHPIGPETPHLHSTACVIPRKPAKGVTSHWVAGKGWKRHQKY